MPATDLSEISIIAEMRLAFKQSAKKLAWSVFIQTQNWIVLLSSKNYCMLNLDFLLPSFDIAAVYMFYFCFSFTTVLLLLLFYLCTMDVF